MRRFLVCSALLLGVALCPVSSRAFQGDLTSSPKSKPNPDAGASKSRTASKPKTTTPPPRAAIADLTITCAPGVTVFVDNQQRGATDASGKLTLKGLKAGQHRVVLKKQNYLDAERTILLFAGDSRTENFGLVPAPGLLSVSTNAPGTRILIAGVGGYTDRVDNISLPPADYQISASKPGYRSVTRTVTLAPGQSLSFPLSLDALTPDELLAQAGEAFRQNRGEQAVELTRQLLSLQPDNPKAHALLGAYYYDRDNLSEASSHIVKALSLGESVSVPVKHRHGNQWSGKSLCNGVLTLRRDGLAFRSNEVPSDDFSIPYSKLYEYGLKEMLSLTMKVGIMKGKKEDKTDYKFYSADADATGVLITCAQCQSHMAALVQIIRQFKQ
ncbi:MAG: PEGA domain-containing protein [Acidobacteria bacterium]|nr:PEGA domain-containing protein [Acidobacteriota bacterium]